MQLSPNPLIADVIEHSYQVSRFGRETPDFANFFQTPEFNVKPPDYNSAVKSPER